MSKLKKADVKRWLRVSAVVLLMQGTAALAQDDPSDAASATTTAQPAPQRAPELNRPQLNTVQPGTQPQIVPKVPEINATSYILMDAMTGKVLVEKNADQPSPPASLTKIMTTYVADTELAAVIENFIPQTDFDLA